jgi:hypothetical protein
MVSCWVRLLPASSSLRWNGRGSVIGHDRRLLMQGAAGDQQGAVYFYQEAPDPRSQSQQPAGDSVVCRTQLARIRGS